MTYTNWMKMDEVLSKDWMEKEEVTLTLTKKEAFFILQLLREADDITWNRMTPPVNFAEKAHDIYIKRFYSLPLGKDA